MADQSGPRCGNNPNVRLTPGDRKVVEEFQEYLAARAALQRVRTVLETEHVVGRTALEYRGLITAALMADEAQQPEPENGCTHCGSSEHSWDDCAAYTALTAEQPAVGARQPDTETRPRRGDQFETWLKAQRDSFGWQGANDRKLFDALDSVLNTYRLHADTGTPLDQHACEGQHCDCTPTAAASAAPGRSAATSTDEETRTDVGTEFVHQADHVDGEALARVEAELEQSGVDTPGCDCGHDGMGVRWHDTACEWRSTPPCDACGTRGHSFEDCPTGGPQ